MFGHNSTGFGWGKKGVAQNLGQTIALNHYNRVTAAGGVLPCGVVSLAAIINAICTALGLTTEAQFNAAVPEGLDPHYSGYLAGAGSGVTLGQACQKIFNWSGASGDVSQGTAGSMPLLLAYDGVNKYYWNGGVIGNYCSTPNAASNQITGDIEIVSKIDYKNNATLQAIVDKSNGTAFNYSLYIDGSNVPKFIYSVLGVVQTAICSSNIGASFNGYIKATRTFVNGVFKFFTSSDGITYTQLGTDISGTIGLLDSNSHPLSVGLSQPASFPFQGKIYRATISNSIGGAPVVDFNPNTYNAATSQTNWTSTTGEVWTLNVGTASNGLKACIVDRTICQGDGVAHVLSASFTQAFGQTVFLATNTLNYTLNQRIISGYVAGTKELAKNPSSGNVAIFANAGNISVAATQGRLGLLTLLWNASGTLQYNNGTASTGDTTDSAPNGVTLFARGDGSGGGGNFSNVIINTHIELQSVATTQQKTDMYNVIRSMNNNAF